MTKEEEMYSILNELGIEKTILENTLSQPKEQLDKYPEDLLEQYKEELEMFKRTIDYIEKLQKENEELKENYIPKDKIREKLNWYEDTCERLSKSGIELDMYDRYQGAIELCKELLEEE